MEYYFDMEVGLEEGALEETLAGKRVALTPENCRIITMQFQLLDRAGRPASPLIVKKVWETGASEAGKTGPARAGHIASGGFDQEEAEEAMVRQFIEQNLSSSPWDFIPVGYNVLFDIGMLAGRAKKLGVKVPASWEMYHQRPFIDVKHILLGMNGFGFRDSGLDKFTGKGGSGKDVPLWYARGRGGDLNSYRMIEQYVEKEAREFVGLYARLKSELPKLRVQMGLFSKEAAATF
ncbi:MAG: hypothetical protein WC759_03355 [Candidatus Micrarchaeia archaeon]